MSIEPKSTNRYWHHDVSIREFLGADYPEFDEMWDSTDRISGSYTRLNSAVLFKYAKECSGLIVEVGVDQGRSGSILLHCAKNTGAKLVFVDSWESVLVENKAKFIRICEQSGYMRYLVWHTTSEKAATDIRKVTTDIDMLHIDANHYRGGVDVDCQLWLPMLKSGGVVLFHDYASSFEAVTDSVDRYTEGWEDLGSWDSLAVRRKP